MTPLGWLDAALTDAGFKTQLLLEPDAGHTDFPADVPAAWSFLLALRPPSTAPSSGRALAAEPQPQPTVRARGPVGGPPSVGSGPAPASQPLEGSRPSGGHNGLVPSQLSGRSHPSAAARQRSLRGAQVPDPHPLQGPRHAVSQHTPSLQKPVAHCAQAVHGAPRTPAPAAVTRSGHAAPGTPLTIARTRYSPGDTRGSSALTRLAVHPRAGSQAAPPLTSSTHSSGKLVALLEKAPLPPSDTPVSRWPVNAIGPGAAADAGPSMAGPHGRPSRPSLKTSLVGEGLGEGAPSRSPPATSTRPSGSSAAIAPWREESFGPGAQRSAAGSYSSLVPGSAAERPPVTSTRPPASSVAVWPARPAPIEAAGDSALAWGS